MTRVVVDPGVFVSALIGQRGGPPDLVVRAMIDDRIQVVASPLLMEELGRVLRRPKFAKYADDLMVSEFVERVSRHAAMAADPADRPAATRDPHDDYLVALARREGVDAIVSGDRDLLDAGLEDPAVWTPRRLVEHLRGQ